MTIGFTLSPSGIEKEPSVPFIVQRAQAVSEDKANFAIVVRRDGSQYQALSLRKGVLSVDCLWLDSANWVPYTGTLTLKNISDTD